MLKERAYISPRNVGALSFAADQSDEVLAGLNQIGIGMDALVGPSTPTAGSPVENLRTWLPGFVHTVTAPVKIDELIGLSSVGNWEDEEIVQGMLEMTGRARPYGDYSDVPLSSFNMSYETRHVVRFEEGVQITILEDKRAQKAGVNSADVKRKAAAKALNVERNLIGFYGYNSTVIRNYGFLNDPNLPNYVTVATGASSDTEWAGKTFSEITADIRVAMSELHTQSGGTIDPEKDNITMAIASEAYASLSVTGSEGTKSVRQWIKETYSNCRIVSCHELNGANGGENVFYLYAENVGDSGDDDGRVFTQIVPATIFSLGSEQRAKASVEVYSNATAGALLKRPYAVIRKSGV